MKRCGVYFFYDADGIVDRYVDYNLSCLAAHLDRLLVVCNGVLSEQGRAIIEKSTTDIIVRKNEGFDAWAFKEAIDFLGWTALKDYDELLLTNFTIMGPVYDLSEVFTAMDQQPELDFWGITKCFDVHSEEIAKYWHVPYDYCPEHIQSSFIVYRNSLLSSPLFQDFWNNMPTIETYFDSGGKYEQFITKHLHDNGFTWGCYTNYDDMDEEFYDTCPLITMPMDVIKHRRSPYFKRRSFFTGKDNSSIAVPVKKQLMDYLKNETNYDVSMVYENLIRTCNQRDLAESLLLMHFV